MIFKKALFLLFIPFTVISVAQDKKYARDVIEKLASPEMYGRGYVDNGDIIASLYIASEFKKHELEPLGNSFLQPFELSINTFPDTVLLQIDNKTLRPGTDFMVGGGSPTAKGTYKLVYLDTSALQNTDKYKSKLNHKIAVLPAVAERDKRTYDLNAAGYIFTHKNNIYWRLSDATVVKPHFYFHTFDSLIAGAGTVEVNIQNKYIENYKTANVLAKIKGKTEPDSFYVFTAHYDHLGKMGSDVYFPGANDNGSGTAMLLDMARHYSRPGHAPDYSMLFIAFAAEESGLWGSKYAAKNFPTDLKQIKFLFNLDMIGSGSEGIGMVNAREVPKADSLIRDINREKEFFADIRSGGARCNSDHCAFAQKDVPSIFIFTRGKEYMHYHTPEDKGPVPLTKWDELFLLLDEFMVRY